MHRNHHTQMDVDVGGGFVVVAFVFVGEEKGVVVVVMVVV